MKLVLQFFDFSTIYTELNIFQPLERTLTTAFCGKPPRNSLFLTHPSLTLCFSLIGGASCFFSPSPLFYSRPQAERRGSAVACPRRRSCPGQGSATRRSLARRPAQGIPTPPLFPNPSADSEHHGRRRDKAQPWWPATPGPRVSQMGG
jgi:hypothetical protein